MVIKVFYSSTPGNMQVREHQSWLERTFAGRGVRYEKVDIAAAGSEKDRRYMIDEARKSGKKTVLPPQVFIDEKYFGGYEELWDANECEQLLSVLGLAPEPAPPAPAPAQHEPSPAANDKSPTPPKEASPAPEPASDATEKSASPAANSNAGAEVIEEAGNEVEVSGTVETETPQEST